MRIKSSTRQNSQHRPWNSAQSFCRRVAIQAKIDTTLKGRGDCQSLHRTVSPIRQTGSQGLSAPPRTTTNQLCSDQTRRTRETQRQFGLFTRRAGQLFSTYLDEAPVALGSGIDVNGATIVCITCVTDFTPFGLNLMSPHTLTLLLGRSLLSFHRAARRR